MGDELKPRLEGRVDDPKLQPGTPSPLVIEGKKGGDALAAARAGELAALEEAELLEETSSVPQPVGQSFWYYKRIPLSKLFPVSHLHAVKMVFPWILWVSIGWAGYAYFASVQGAWRPQTLPALMTLGALVLASGVVIVKLTYHELYRMTFGYEIDGLRLNLSRGIMLPVKGSLPLSPVTEVYVRRDALDVLLGLANLQIVVPLEATKRFALVEGLRYKDAVAFQTYMADQLSKLNFVPQVPDKNPETGERTEHRRHLANARA